MPDSPASRNKIALEEPLVAHHQALLGDLSKAEVERISNDLARLADSIERAKPH